MTSRTDEHLASGAPIYRGEAAPPAHSCAEEICAHVGKHIGRIEKVLPELASDLMHIDVHHVPPVESRPYHTLVTAGMSDRPMHVPPDVHAPRYLELMVTLPAQWQVGDSSDEWYWPIRQLKFLASLPHVYRTWLGWGHTVPNGDPPEPLAPTTKLCGAIIAPSLMVSSAFYELTVGQKQIAFFSVIPIYREEIDLKLKEGMEALLARLVQYDINDVIEPRRRNAAKRFFGLF